MTTRTDRPNAGLLVIDVQRDVVALGHDREAVLANINRLVDEARAADVPVIWIQHNDEYLPVDTEGWQLADELAPLPGDPVVHKTFRSSFDDTNLETVLDKLGVGRLVIAGAQSDFCVRWTLHGALQHGYDTVLAADAHTTDDPPNDSLPSAAQAIAQLNNTWASQDTNGPTVMVTPTAEVSFS